MKKDIAGHVETHTMHDSGRIIRVRCHCEVSSDHSYPPAGAGRRGELGNPPSVQRPSP